MPNTCRFVTLSVATVDIPATGNGSLPAMLHLAAVGVLIADRNAVGTWQFELRRHAIAAGEGEDKLLAWATEVMPTAGIVIGWHLADRIVPALLDAAADGDPEIGRAFLDRLTKLVTAPSVDLASPHGGAGASLETVAWPYGIATPSMSAGDIESAWAVGDVQRLCAHVEAEAIAVWRLWLAESNDTAGAASEAFSAWLASRIDRSAVS